jgi:hypothetical protein
MDRRRTSMDKLVFRTSRNLHPRWEIDCTPKTTFLFFDLTNKQMTDDFHSLKISPFETGGAWFFYVVPGGVMRDFLINFKTGDFYQKVKGLMQAIPGNSVTSYYQFHWMMTKKQFNGANVYDWRDNKLMQTAMSYPLESMIHQIMDR